MAGSKEDNQKTRKTRFFNNFEEKPHHFRKIRLSRRDFQPKAGVLARNPEFALSNHT
jgi:hypothetical protein